MRTAPARRLLAAIALACASIAHAGCPPGSTTPSPGAIVPGQFVLHFQNGYPETLQKKLTATHVVVRVVTPGQDLAISEPALRAYLDFSLRGMKGTSVAAFDSPFNVEIAALAKLFDIESPTYTPDYLYTASPVLQSDEEDRYGMWWIHEIGLDNVAKRIDVAQRGGQRFIVAVADSGITVANRNFMGLLWSTQVDSATIHGHNFLIDAPCGTGSNQL